MLRKLAALAAFMYLVTTEEPDDIIYLIHVTLIPEQGDDHEP